MEYIAICDYSIRVRTFYLSIIILICFKGLLFRKPILLDTRLAYNAGITVPCIIYANNINCVPDFNPALDI